MFNNNKKKLPPPAEDALCTVCGQKTGPLKNKHIRDIPEWMPPGVLMVYDHEVPGVEVPLCMYFCKTCLESLVSFISFQVSCQDEAKQEQEIMERLLKLDAGTVLTMVEDEVHPLPEPGVREMLSSTPFSKIWDL